MKTHTKTLLLLICLSVCALTALAQNWEYINLRQYRVKDTEALQKFVKHAYPFFNSSKKIPVVNRIAATSESGRIYAATYFSNLDQFATLLKEWNSVWGEYTQAPGNLSQEFMTNQEAGIDDVLWKLNKDLTSVPEGFDPSKMPWRKLHFVSIKMGMMSEFESTWKKIMELEKKAGISYAFYILNATYGAPTNTVLISVPAESAVDYYTKSAARQKIRETNPEIVALRKKIGSFSSNTLIDQITMIAY